MAEVKQQASSCALAQQELPHRHPGLPVLALRARLPGPAHLPVRRWLCEAVRDSCEPVMQFFGFTGPRCLRQVSRGRRLHRHDRPTPPRPPSPKVRLGSPAASRAWGTCPRPCPTASRSPRWCPAGQPCARTCCGSLEPLPLGNPVSRKTKSFSSGSQRALFSPCGREASPHRSFEPSETRCPRGWGGGKHNPNSKSGKRWRAEQMLRCSFVYILRFEEDF